MRRCHGKCDDTATGWLSLLAVAGLLAIVPANAGDRLAEAFGQLPQMWGVRLSPGGDYLSFLHMDEKQDVPVALVASADTGEANVVIASPKDRFDLRWCEWASNQRLLCGFTGIDRIRGTQFGTTRIAAVDRTGENLQVLLQDGLSRRWGLAQFQDNIIDWLRDDPEHVLVGLPDTEPTRVRDAGATVLGFSTDRGVGVARMNIYDGRLQTVYRARSNVRDWLSDGRGEVRARYYASVDKRRWEVRVAGGDDWQTLFEASTDDLDTRFRPVGFGEHADDLLFFAGHEGRLALFSRRLPDGPDRLVFAHDEVDVSGMYSLGRFGRLVAVTYSTDRPQQHFIDPSIERLVERISGALPGHAVSVVDESRDRRFYLVHVSSDQDPGHYYRFDTETSDLRRFWPKHPALEGMELSPMRPIAFVARDGGSVPAYLTLPVAPPPGPLPLIVLPHGGPQSRDVWGYDWLVQFFASRGYAVLQVNYRGSGGYGEAWAGEGGFRAWQLAISDITDGVRQLVADDIADPDRLCIVGWSYGGYAALMSAVEEPDLYRCAVSIAGVSDPMTLIQDAARFLNRKAVAEFVGTDAQVIKAGSPLRRADEITVPVLLFHGDEDLNVSVDHSRKMHSALKSRRLSKLRVYDDAEHGIWSNRYRVDMLTRIGAFVDRHTASR